MPLLLRAAPAVAAFVTFAPLLAPLPGQQPDAARQPPQVVHVRDATTGSPLPGVVLRVGPSTDEPHLVDGWLRRFGRRPAAAKAVRSDPDGRVTLTEADAGQSLTVDCRFRLVEDRRRDGERVLLVEEQPHHAVHVVDASGRTVVDFALLAPGLLQTERTDASGLATFSSRPWLGATPGGAAPTFVPVQWIGPAASMPKAAVRRDERVTRMQVPPHVNLRVRFLRHGVPVPIAVDAAWLSLPIEHGLWGARETPRVVLQRLGPVTCRGIEAGPVAWTGEVRGEVRIGRLCLPFGSTTFPATGRTLAIDVETDPPRPRLSGVVRTTDGATPRTVSIGAATDAGVFHDEVGVGADGRLLASFDAQWLRGTVLRRVWIDALDPPGSAAVALAHDVPLRDEAIALGDVVLAPHEPVLRGCVVDARGAVLTAAVVTVHAAGAVGTPATVELPVDGTGRFTLAGPLFRDANGDVVPAVASAAVAAATRVALLGSPAAPVRSPSSPPTAHGGTVELVVPDRATGAVALVVRGAPPRWRSQLRVQRVVDGNQRLLHDERLATTDDSSAWHRGDREVPAGRCRLQLLTMNQLLYEVELDVAPTLPADPGAVLEHTVDFGAITRERSIRAVDEAGRSVPEARVLFRSNGHRSGIMPDDRGELTWLEPLLLLRHAAYLVAPGKQVIRLPASAAGAVTLAAAVPVVLRLRNDDGSAIEGRWTVMLDPCDDTGLAAYCPMADDGAVHFPGPAPGRYHVALLRDFQQYPRRVRVGTGEVAGGQLAPAELSLDGAARTALRALRDEPPPAK